MKINLTAKTLLSSFVISFFYVISLAQLTPRDFTLLSGPNSPGTTLIGSSITINGGKVGAYKLVQTTGNSTINADIISVSYTHLRAHETGRNLVCRLLLEKKKK